MGAWNLWKSHFLEWKCIHCSSCVLQSRCWGFVLSIGAYCWESLGVFMEEQLFRDRYLIEGNCCGLSLHPHQDCLVWYQRLRCSVCRFHISAGSGNVHLGPVSSVCPSFTCIWTIVCRIEYWLGFCITLLYHSSVSILWKGIRVSLFRMDVSSNICFSNQYVKVPSHSLVMLSSICILILFSSPGVGI